MESQDQIFLICLKCFTYKEAPSENKKFFFDCKCPEEGFETTSSKVEMQKINAEYWKNHKCGEEGCSKKGEFLCIFCKKYLCKEHTESQKHLTHPTKLYLKDVISAEYCKPKKKADFKETMDLLQGKKGDIYKMMIHEERSKKEQIRDRLTRNIPGMLKEFQLRYEEELKRKKEREVIKTKECQILWIENVERKEGYFQSKVNKHKEEINEYSKCNVDIYDFKVEYFTSGEKAIQFLKDKEREKEENLLIKKRGKKYDFYYSVVAGNLFDEYIKGYQKEIEDLSCFVANTILYKKDKKEEELAVRKSAQASDPFLCSGGKKDNFIEVVLYILKDDIKEKFKNYGLTWDKLNSLCTKENRPRNGLFPDVQFKSIFKIIKGFEEVTISVLLGKMLGAKEISHSLIEEFMSFLFQYRHKTINKLVNPTWEKIIEIPIKYLAKPFLALYTLETPFYSDMNKNLTNGTVDIYKAYISVLYYALDNKIIQSFEDKPLYRGAIISIEDFEELQKLFESFKKKKQNQKVKDPTNALAYRTSCFLSFTKTETVADNYVRKGSDLPGTYKVKYVVEEFKHQSKNYLISNVDMYNYSLFPNEEEVLFLPFTYFEIKNIEVIKKDNYTERTITLNYLDAFQRQIDEEFENNPKHMNKVINKVLDSEEISDFTQMIEEDITKEDITKCLTDKDKTIYSTKTPEEDPRLLHQPYFEAYYYVKKWTDYKETWNAESRFDILGNSPDFNFDYLNGNNCFMYIDRKLVTFTKTFKTEGPHVVKIILKPDFQLRTTAGMFYRCCSLEKIDLSHFKIEKVNNTQKMFYGCERLKFFDSERLNTKKVKNMSGMFHGCVSLESAKFREDFITENVNDFSEMFYYCSSIKRMDLTYLSIKSAKDMNRMFMNCKNLSSLDVNNDFRIQPETNYDEVFRETMLSKEFIEDRTPMIGKKEETKKETKE